VISTYVCVDDEQAMETNAVDFGLMLYLHSSRDPAAMVCKANNDDVVHEPEVANGQAMLYDDIAMNGDCAKTLVAAAAAAVVVAMDLVSIDDDDDEAVVNAHVDYQDSTVVQQEPFDDNKL
jgi:hypothetical protein